MVFCVCTGQTLLPTGDSNSNDFLLDAKLLVLLLNELDTLPPKCLGLSGLGELGGLHWIKLALRFCCTKFKVDLLFNLEILGGGGRGGGFFFCLCVVNDITTIHNDYKSHWSVGDWRKSKFQNIIF